MRWGYMKRPVRILIAATLATGCLLVACVVAYSGTRGLNVILRRDLLIWGAAKPDDERLSPSVRLALQPHPPEAKAGPFSWQSLDAGFEVAEMPVLAAGTDADRILLARIDPAHFRFQVWNRPSGDRDTLDWMTELGAVLVINGSYFTRYGTPATPMLSAGVQSGPAEYDARHGAFVTSSSFVGIRDLAKLDWREALRGADYGFVSYPLLIGADGQSRSKSDPRWLANRSFVAQDENGRIILGTTKDAFFSLDRLAAFLREAPLALKLALNLDGGPIACQAVALKDFRRDFCGRWEVATDTDELRLLKPVFGIRRWGLPIALAVLPK
jgi:phosphodiester glycosidase